MGFTNSKPRRSWMRCVWWSQVCSHIWCLVPVEWDPQDIGVGPGLFWLILIAAILQPADWSWREGTPLCLMKVRPLISCSVLGTAALSERETNPARERQGGHDKSPHYIIWAYLEKLEMRPPGREWETHCWVQLFMTVMQKHHSIYRIPRGRAHFKGCQLQEEGFYLKLGVIKSRLNIHQMGPRTNMFSEPSTQGFWDLIPICSSRQSFFKYQLVPITPFSKLILHLGPQPVILAFFTFCASYLVTFNMSGCYGWAEKPQMTLTISLALRGLVPSQAQTICSLPSRPLVISVNHCSYVFISEGLINFLVWIQGRIIIKWEYDCVMLSFLPCYNIH